MALVRKQITRAFKSRLKRRFLREVPFHVFVRRTNIWLRQLDSENFFNISGLAFLRDAWIASEIAKAQKESVVSLICDERPDFCIINNAEKSLFEACEVDYPNRNRGLEYRASSGRTGFPKAELITDSILTERETADIIFKGIHAKVLRGLELAEAGIGYPENTSLAVYVNLSQDDLIIADVVDIVRKLLASDSSASSVFSRIVLLWQADLFELPTNENEVEDAA